MILPRIGESQGRILQHLKRQGSATIPEMARALDLSVETVRAHLRSLGSEGLVERRGSRGSGPGRPEIVYGLMEAADDLFPSQEGRLLQDLARFLEARGQSDLVRAFFAEQVARRRAGVRERLEGLAGDERLEEVARVLTEEGFMADVVTDETGRRVLRLSHCPLRNLVDVTQMPCRAELELVREMVGSTLARVRHMPAGDHACCYAVGVPSEEAATTAGPPRRRSLPTR